MFCMFLVGNPQTPEPVIPNGRLAQIDLFVLTCRKTPINQCLKQIGYLLKQKPMGVDVTMRLRSILPDGFSQQNCTFDDQRTVGIFPITAAWSKTDDGFTHILCCSCICLETIWFRRLCCSSAWIERAVC